MTLFGKSDPACRRIESSLGARSPGRYCVGLSLVELLVGVIIIALLSLFAQIPLDELIRGQRYTQMIERLETTLARARNESILQGITTTVCLRRGVSAQCGSGNLWNQGWILFVDQDGDGWRNPSEPILEMIGPEDAMTTLSFNNRSQSYITFKPNGLTSQFGSFTFCNRSIIKGEIRIVVSIMGLTRQESARKCPG